MDVCLAVRQADVYSWPRVLASWRETGGVWYGEPTGSVRLRMLVVRGWEGLGNGAMRAAGVLLCVRAEPISARGRGCGTGSCMVVNGKLQGSGAGTDLG